MKTIIFDDDSVGWTSDVDLNLEFLKLQAEYINDTLKYRGYVYLNQIYEQFGAKWNPELVNSCYTFGRKGIMFGFEPVEDGRILIYISQRSQEKTP